MRGSLPCGCHRGRPQLRIRCRDARGTTVRQAEAAGQRRPLGSRDRAPAGTGRAISMIANVFFYIFSVILLASAAMVVSARNPVHSVLFLILSFFNAAALFLIAGAEFLAMILLIVYVGAVAVLFLFVVMMLDIDFAELRSGFQRYLPVGATIGAILFGELALVLGGWKFAPDAATLRLSPASAQVSNTAALGRVLYTDYVFLFQ